MANEKNLIPNTERTPSERRKIAQKAGKASGEARRKRKTLKDNMELLLNLPVSDVKSYNAVAKMYVDVEDIDNSMLLTLGLFKKAAAGDVAAYKEIRDLIGEEATQNNEAVIIIDDIENGNKAD